MQGSSRRGGATLAGEIILTAEAFSWGLQEICKLHRIPFARGRLLQQFPPPHTVTLLHEAAASLGLNCELRDVASAANLSRASLPLVAVLRPVPSRSAPAVSAGPNPTQLRRQACRLVMVINADAMGISYFEEGTPQLLAATPKEFDVLFAGKTLHCLPKAPALNDADAASASRVAFGFRWFVPELLRHKAIWRDVLLASLAIQLMALATPVFTQIVIDKVIVHHATSTLIVIGIALGVFIVFTAAMSWVRQYLVLHTGNRIDAVLGAQVFEHLFRLPLGYFERRPTGVLVARMQGVETIREFLSGAAVTLLMDVPFLLIFLAIMFYYNVALTVITICVLLAIVGLSLAVAPMLRQRLDQQFLLGARNQAFLTEYVSGLETVKSLQMEPQLKQRFGDYLAAYLQAGFRTKQLANSYNVAAHTLEQLLTLIILCFGAWLVMTQQDFTIGMLVAFQMFAGRISQPMLHLVGLWQQFQQAEIAVRRLGDVMNVPAEPYSVLPDWEETRDGKIEMRDLAFRYADNLPYLYKGFNLTIEPGQCVVIMGPSGSGKSTLAKLLQGFYRVEDGVIAIDGRDTRYMSANDLRSYFGVVPQDTVLFSNTIYGNLVSASPLASFEEVIEACKLAEIHDMIEQLPQGYRTEVGEHGVGLSGGQKQRIAIARALLKRPRILIFDEATSSLDGTTAEQFTRTINQFKGRVTMVFITHQLPRGLQVDSVITLGQWGTRIGVVGEERKDA